MVDMGMEPDTVAMGTEPRMAGMVPRMAGTVAGMGMVQGTAGMGMVQGMADMGKVGMAIINPPATTVGRTAQRMVGTDTDAATVTTAGRRIRQYTGPLLSTPVAPSILRSESRIFFHRIAKSPVLPGDKTHFGH
jgi:hypothetical protein